MVFNKFYFHEFLIYTSNQVVKNYLLGLDNLLACTMWARALRGSKDGQVNAIFYNLHHINGWGRGFFARNRAQANMVRANGSS